MEGPPSEVGEFTNAVFVAEGLDPDTADRHMYREVRAMIDDAFRESDEKDARPDDGTN
jgi:hypothetical protein